MRRAWIGGLSCVLAGAALACATKGEAGSSAEEKSASSATPGATAALGGGSISGAVKFQGTPPANPAIDMSEEQVCKAKYTSPPADPVVKVSNGGLADVIVYVRSGLPAGQLYPVPSEPVVIDQRGCLYHPRSLAIMAGQKLEIKNDDEVLHNIKVVPAKNRGFNISQPKAGMTTTRSFATPEMTVPVECNVHGWMHANIAVLDHPFYAVSGPDGSFTIKGLPPGTYTVEAWHSKLGTKTATVTVPPNGSGSAAFTYSATAS